MEFIEKWDKLNLKPGAVIKLINHKNTKILQISVEQEALVPIYDAHDNIYYLTELTTGDVIVHAHSFAELGQKLNYALPNYRISSVYKNLQTFIANNDT